MILYENNIQHQIKTGKEVSINNTLNTYIEEAKLSKLSTQYTTTGKNQIGLSDTSSTTTSNITYSITNNVLSLNGTASAKINITALFNLTTTAKKTLKIYIDSGTFTSGAVGISLRNSNDTQTDYIQINQGSLSGEKTLTLTGLDHIYLYITSGSAFSNAKIRFSLMDNYSDTYEPYTNGASPNPDYPQEVKVVNGYRNLLKNTSTNSGDNNYWYDYSTYDEATGTITKKTSATTETYLKHGYNFKAGTIYTLSFLAKSNGYVKNIDVMAMNSNVSKVYAVSVLYLTTEFQKIVFTFTTENNVDYTNGYIRFDNNGSTTSGTEAILTIKDVMLVEGSTENAYVPCDNANYINIIDNGSNNIFKPTLLNYVIPTRSEKITQANCSVVLDGNTFKLTATGTDMYLGQVRTSGQTYVNSLGLLFDVSDVSSVSFYLTNPLFVNNYITTYDENLVSLGFVKKGTSSGTYDLPSGAKYLSFRFGLVATTGTTYETKVMLVKGSTVPTEYEAYKEKLIPIPLNNNFIGGISTYKDQLLVDKDGHCYLNKKIGKYVYTGNESERWTFINSNNNNYLFQSLGVNIQIENYSTTYLCSHALPNSASSGTGNVGSYVYGNIFRMRVPNTIATTSTDFSTWLASNNVELYYPLAEPQLIDLNYTVDLELYEGINTITNSENADMNITFASYLDISKNGLGYLNNVLNAKVTEELNGDYQLVFDYPLNDTLSNELIEERIVKCQVADGTQQCFIIKNVVKTYDKMTITCKHLFYLLLTNIAEDIYPQNLSPKPFLDWVLTKANYHLPFTTTSDVSVQKTARYVRKNLVEVILGESDNSMINLFGIEINRNNWNIGLNSRIGADRGEKLIYGKNITGINITIDTSELYTRIMPVGYDGLLLPEKYVDASNINEYPYPKIAIIEFSDIKYDPEDDTAYHNINDAYDALRAAVQELYDNGINKPKVNVKIDWLELSKTEEYKQYANLERVSLGDTIHANIFGLEYTTRVIKTVYNPLNDKIEQFEVGSVQADYATQMNKYEFDLQKINPASILDQAKENATNLITTAMGGYVYKTTSELYIMDNPDPAQAQKVWRWNVNGLGYSSTGVNGTYGLAMTMDGSIVADFITTGVLRTSVIEGYDSLALEVHGNTGQISDLVLSVGELNSKIQDIADITTAAESEFAEVQLLNVNESQPIQIKIHPTNNKNISYLYPRANLYPSDTLYMPNRIIRFTNTTTSEVFEYELFDDLLYYDEDNYDEFYLDYDSNAVQITKKCEYDANGNVVLKSTPVVETTSFPTIEQLTLTTGNYTINLPGYTNGYLLVRCMASNIYTSQFATISELSQTASQIRTEVSGTYATQNALATVDSRITQTATSITSSVAETYQTKSDAQSDYSSLNSTITQTASGINTEVSKKVGKTEVISSINQSAEDITISANKVNVSGVITAINNNTSTTINGGKITSGSITSSKVNSSIITTSNFSAQSISASKINSGSLTSSNVKIGSWSLNGTGILSSTCQIYPSYLGYRQSSSSGWSSVNWYGVGRAGTSYSDKKLKKNIKSLDEKFNGFFDDLKPVSFKWKSTKYKTDDKEHIGFIAQDIKEAEKNNDLDLDLVYKDKELLNLDKREIIALNTWQIQLLKKEIKGLKKEIEELKKGR